MRKIAWLFLLVLIAFPVIFSGGDRPVSWAQDGGEGGDDSPSDAPFVQYLSPRLNALVIERADGTDSRVIGEGLMPEGANYLSGAGWSPSGEWLAVTAVNRGAYGVSHERRSLLIELENDRALDILDNYDEAYLRWSPTEDLLLVVAAENPPEVNETGPTPTPTTTPTPHPEHENAFDYRSYLFDMRIGLVNPAAARFVFARDVVQFLGESYPYLAWTADGEYAIVRYERPLDVENWEWEVVFLVIDRTGKLVKEQRFPGRSEVPSLLSTGELLHREPEKGRLVIESLLTGATETYQVSGGTELAVDWDHTRRYALVIVTYQAKGEESNEVWLIDREARSSELLHDDAFRILSLLASGPAWSPESSHAIFLSSDGEAMHLDMATREVEPLGVYVFGFRWEAGWDWLDDERLMVLGPMLEDKERRPLYRYNLADGTHERLPYQPGAEIPDFTSDGRYAAYVGEGPVIVQVETGEERRLRPHSHGWITSWGGEAFWHPEQNWLIAWEDALIAGGAYIRNTTVTNHDGTIHRDLGRCYPPTTLCTGWLPPRITEDMLPSAQEIARQHPQQVLPGQAWVRGLQWGPQSRLLVVQSIINGGEYAVWDVNRQEVVTRQEYFESPGPLQWKTDQTGELVLGRSEAPPVPAGFQDHHILAISPDGTQLVTNREAITVYEVATGTLMHEFDAEYRWYDSGEYSPDGRWLALQGGHEDVLVVDTETWEVSLKMDVAGQAVAFSPDGEWLAVGVSWDVHLYAVDELVGE
jgi:WD40 repeat protein